MKEMKLQKKHQMKDMLLEMIPLQRSTEAQAMNTKKVSKKTTAKTIIKTIMRRGTRK